MIPSDELGCQPVKPLTEISSEGASNTDTKHMKIPSDKAELKVPPDGISRPSTFIKEEAMAKDATTFSPPPHNHKDTTPSSLVVPPGGLSVQPSWPEGARRIETNAASLPSNYQKDIPPSGRFPLSGLSVQSSLTSQPMIKTAGLDHSKAAELPWKSHKDKTATRVPPDGLSIKASSVTTDGNANINALVVELPLKNGNDRTQSGAKTPSGIGVISQPSSVTTNAVPEGASNVASQAISTAGHRIAGKSLSCPDDSAVTKKEECRELKRYNSELLPKPMEKKRKFKPSKVVLLI